MKVGKMISTVYALFFLINVFFSASPLEGGLQRYNVYSSDEKNFVWVRVFKVASGSTKHVLASQVSDLTQSRPKFLPKEFKDHFKFTFVRNTWDRLASCYFHKVVTKKATDFEICFGKDFDFFIDYINTLDVTRTNPHIKLQTRLVPVDELDFIGKLDNFAHDLKYVCDVIGIKCDEIPHKHKTDHAHYSTYYTPRTRQIVAKKYKEEIDAFGFTFETE